MERTFEKFSSRVITIPLKDIDTDIIIPAKFLKTTKKEGLGESVFYNLRKDRDDFPLDRKEFKGARIVVAGTNFGCGSSREHAPWALKDAGIDVIISSQFADIFKGNAEKNEVLPIVLEEKIVEKLLYPKDELEELTIDLENQEVITASGKKYSFEITEFSKKRFTENISDLDYLLDYAPQIRKKEEERKQKLYF